jgi:maleamate amidohydrolase
VSRSAGLPVIFTRVAYRRADLRDAGLFLEKCPSLRFARAGTANVELDPRLGRERGEKLVTKQFASAFYGTRLGSKLKAREVDTVVVCGCTTSGCVRATVVDALQGGFRALIPRECVADIDPEPHTASLFDMDSKYGDVISADEAIELIRSQVTP